MVFIILASSLFFSCQPAKDKTQEESKLCTPHSLTIDSLANNYAKIAWNPGCPGIRVMRGFDIFVSPISLVKKYPGREIPDKIKPFNPEIYPGDAEGRDDLETYEIENVNNLTRYYVHVRAKYNDRSYSVPSNEVELVIYPQGIIELATSYSGDRAGFSFTENIYCKTDALENDIYFYGKDGIDYICSASRLGPVNRKNNLFAAGKDKTLPDPEKLNATGNAADRIPVAAGQNLIVETEEGHKAGIYIDSFEGSGENRIAVLKYFYKPSIDKPIS